MVAQLRTGATHGDDLGMRAGVVLGEVSVPAFAKQFPVGANQNRTNGNFVVFAFGPIRQSKSMLHPFEI